MLLMADTPECLAADQKRLSDWLTELRPDAILSDVASLRESLAVLGHQIPQEIGLASLSTYPGSGHAGIHQNSMEVGSMAVNRLIAMIHRNERGIPANYHVHLAHPAWVEGDTLQNVCSVA